MRELRFASHAVEAVVLPEAGARLHRLRAFGRDVLRTPDDPARHASEPFSWGAYVMAPWCNRLQPGPMRFGSRQLDLAANFPDGTAIHGQVYSRAWSVGDDGSLAIHGGGDGWPWRYEVVQRLRVDETSLRLELGLTNLDHERMPAGIGLHPWFVRPGTVAIHADQAFPDNLQTDAEPEPVAGAFDLRRPVAMPTGIDATWAALTDPPVELTWPGLRAVVRFEAAHAFVVAASPGGMDAVAVEVQSHAPQGLRRLINGEPGALDFLEPGDTLPLTLTFAFEELPAPSV